MYAPLRAQVKAEIVDWWHSRGGETTTAPLALLRELREQVASVKAEAIDLRFTSLIWGEQDTLQ